MGSSRKLPALIALAGLALAVVLFVGLRDDGDEAAEPRTTRVVDPQDLPQSQPDGQGQKKPRRPEQPDVPAIEVRGGEPVGGPQEIEVQSGEEIVIDVTSDAADELHLHGYDAYLDLPPGKPATLREPADIEGLFELESHTTGVLLAEISVVP